jgi:hypothetical protein
MATVTSMSRRRWRSIFALSPRSTLRSRCQWRLSWTSRPYPSRRSRGGSRRWTTARKHRLPTPSLSMASCSSPRSSGSLTKSKKRGRSAHFRPRIIADNHARRAVTAAPVVATVEKGEVVAVGNARRPVMTPDSTVAIAATRQRTASSPGVRVRHSWPKMKTKSPHYF